MYPLHDRVAGLLRRTAAEIVLPRFRALAAHEIMEKAPGDLVTVADQESEARLTEGLADLLPAARVIGEEASAADPSLLDGIDRGLAWIIDPIDGTTNFSEGKTPFALMVGLVSDGVSEAGWILDPLTDRLCHAVRGGGAFVDGQRVTTRPSGDPRPVTAIAMHYLPPDRRSAIEARAAGRLEIVAIPRCAGEQYPRLVLGRNDVTLFERCHAWDHVPGALFLTEAGGKVAWPDGTDYRVGIPRLGMIGAATPALWEQARAVLFD